MKPLLLFSLITVFAASAFMGIASSADTPSHTDLAKDDSASNDVRANREKVRIKPFAAYTFESSSTLPQVEDRTGHLPGKLVGPSACVQGRQGSVLQLDGKGFVEIPAGSSLVFTNGITLEAWLCPDEPAIGRIIDRSTVGDANSFCLDLYPAETLRFITPAGSVSAIGVVPTGQWSHVSAVYDAEVGDTDVGRLAIYVNGLCKTNQPCSTGISIGGTNSIRIGADSRGESRFRGKLDDVRIYACALGADSISARYNGREVEVPVIPVTTCYSVKDQSPQVDFKQLLARNDLVYLAPATYPVEGMPIGCRNMGVVMWNQNGFDFQVNNIANWRGTSSGRIHISNEASLLKSYSKFEQRQSLAEGTLKTRIQYPDGDLEMTAFVAEGKDLLVVHIRDSRANKGDYYVDLNMWREWGRMTACMVMTNGVISITEKGNAADKNEWLNSAYALSVASDIGTVVVTNVNDSTLRLTIPKASASEFTVYAANPVLQASSKENPLEVAARLLDEAKQRKWNTLWEERKAWWSAFWKESFVYLTSPDHVADYMENLWYLHLYWMASQSTGEYCPIFGAGNFKMNEDYYSWGNRYWYQNTREMFWALLPANHVELIAPFYRHYRNVLPVQQEMTKKLFNVAGAQYEETMAISGQGDKYGNSYTLLYLTTGIEISLQFYRHYLFTRDETFLRDMAYPIMKETSLFYLNWVRKEADGKYHIYPTSSKETYWRVKDNIIDFAAIRRMFPILIAESRKLNLDAELRPRWQDVLDNLAPFPIDPEKGSWAPCVFLKDPPPVDNPYVEKQYGPKNTSHSMAENKNSENIACELIFPWELAGIGSDNYDLALKTFHARPFPYSGGWDQASVWAARLGLRDEAVQVLRTHANGQNWTQGFWHNSACMYWGSSLVLETYFDSSGVNAMGTSEMLLQSHDGIIRVFPATPKKWSGAFSLRAQSGFKVFSEMDRGLIHLVFLESLFGDECRLANPWPGAKALVTDGKKVILESDSAILQFKTAKGRKYLVQNTNAPLSKMVCKPLAPEPNQGPKWPGTYQWTDAALTDYLKQGGGPCLGISADGRTPLRYRTAREQEKEAKELGNRIGNKTNLALASRGGLVAILDPDGKSRSAPYLNNAVYGFYNITWIKQGSSVVIDLGNVKKISGIYWSLDRQCTLTFQQVLIGNYTIEVSSDAKQWRQVATVSENIKTNGRWDGFEPTEARYVRMVISPKQPSWRPRLGMDEFDVY